MNFTYYKIPLNLPFSKGDFENFPLWKSQLQIPPLEKLIMVGSFSISYVRTRIDSLKSPLPPLLKGGSVNQHGYTLSLIFTFKNLPSTTFGKRDFQKFDYEIVIEIFIDVLISNK